MDLLSTFKKIIAPNPTKGNSISDDNFYYPIGRASIVGKLIAYTLTIILALVVALIYNLLIALIPFPYINFFITLGVGIVMGYSVNIFSKIGKLRNYKERTWIGVFTGLIVYYFQWASFTMLALNNFEFSIDFALYFDIIVAPIPMFETISLINKFGTWSIFDIEFNGILLTLVWIIEGLMIIVVPFLIVRTQPLTPYSETLDKWYDLFRFDQFFENIPFTFKNDLEEKGTTAIDELGKGLAQRHGRISLYYLPDEEYAYLSADNILKIDDDKGTDTTNIINSYKIDKQSALYLMEKYRYKKCMWLEH